MLVITGGLSLLLGDISVYISYMYALLNSSRPSWKALVQNLKLMALVTLGDWVLVSIASLYLLHAERDQFDEPL